MRVGIDATAMPLQRTGAGNYIFHLIRGLSAIDSVNEYVVFAKARHVAELGITKPNFTFAPVDLPLRGIRLLWEQSALPIRVRSQRLDVLHSPHYTMPLLSSSRRVVTFHDATLLMYPELHQRTKRLFFPRMMRWSSRHADQLIAVSDSTRRDIIEQCGIEPDRIHTVHIASSSSHAPPTEAQMLDVVRRHALEPYRYLLYVGVLEPRKNISLLVEAFGRIAASRPELKLVIAGRKGWMYDAIFAQVTTLGLQERVHFLGYVSETDLPSLYAGARAFVYPSRYEGFGIPVLEAMQCGVPVITSTASSLPEIAGDAALLVDPNDSAAIAHAISRIIDDPHLARSLRARGLERAAQFTWERTAAGTLAVYQRAVEQGA